MLVQKLRLQKGWSQEQLAELSGLSARTIQRIENGQKPSMESAKALASVFEIDFTQLTGEPTMQDAPNARPFNPQSGDARTAEEVLAFRHVRKLRGFYRMLIVYVILIPALAAINFNTERHYYWFLWPALWLGLFLLLRALTVFDLLPFMGPEWEKRQVEKRLGRPLS